MLRFQERRKQGRLSGDQPGLPMHDLVTELMRPSVHELSLKARARLVSDDGGRLCGHLEWSELAPLVYQRVQTHDASLPPSMRERLHDQSRLTAESNSFLLSKLEEISSQFAVHRIPVLVIKGPVLAQLTAGLLVRPFHDLDVLVHRHTLADAKQVLRSLGYTEIYTALRHEHHRIFAHRGANGVAVVELHFGLGDRQRAIAPDLAGIWHRSSILDLSRCAVLAPEITDHLLLTIMQLPHHDWGLRLLVDLGLIISQWHAQIKWSDLVDRAQAWGMWALTASTLYALNSMFGVSVPEPVQHIIRPENYVRRAQWRLVRETVAARLGAARNSRVSRLAPFLLLDRVEDIISLLAHRIVSTRDLRDPHRTAARTAGRVVDGVSSVPALALVLVKSLNAGTSALPRHSSRSVHRGER